MLILRLKEYSQDHYVSYDSPAGHFRRNLGKYLTIGGATLGAACGFLRGKSKAEKLALDEGLEPGTPEYKKFVRSKELKHSLVGGAIGTAAGVGATVGKHLYDVNYHSSKLIKLKAGDIVKVTKLYEPEYKYDKEGGYYYCEEGAPMHKKKLPAVGLHYAVYDGEGGFIDHSPGGIKLRSWDEMMDMYDNPKLKAEPTKKKHTKESLLRAAEKLKEKYNDHNYHIYDNNCEHFAREISEGQRYSTLGDGLVGKIGKLFRIG